MDNTEPLPLETKTFRNAIIHPRRFFQVFKFGNPSAPSLHKNLSLVRIGIPDPDTRAGGEDKIRVWPPFKEKNLD